MLLVPRVQVTETNLALGLFSPQNMMSLSSADIGIHLIMRSVTTQYLQIIKALEIMTVDKLEVCVICHIFSDRKRF